MLNIMRLIVKEREALCSYTERIMHLQIVPTSKKEQDGCHEREAGPSDKRWSEKASLRNWELAEICMIWRNWPGIGLGEESPNRPASRLALILENCVLTEKHDRVAVSIVG